MKPLSEDLRNRIVRAREQGAGVGEVCKRFHVCRSSVERYYRQYQSCAHCRPKQIGGYRKSRLAKHAHRLRAWIASKPDLTLEELQALCSEKLDVSIGINALWHRLDRLGLSYKKNDARKRARQARCAGGQKSLAQASKKTSVPKTGFHR
jgi:transposase